MHRSNACLLLLLLVACGSHGSAPTAPPPRPDPVEPTTSPVVQPPAAPVGLPPVAIADAAPVTGDIGTAGYAAVMASAPDGAWVLVCQARTDTDKDGKIGVSFGHHGELFGDEPAPYLIRGAGSGEVLDEVAGVDPARRYLVVAKGKVMELLDLTTSKRVALRGADTRYEDGVFGGARVVFDAKGERVLFGRLAGTKRKIVVRILATGDESEIDFGGGELRKAELAGGWVVGHVFDPKPGERIVIGGGRSGPKHTVGGRRCRVDYPLPPVTTDLRWASLAGGVAKAREDVVASVGADLIVRLKDESLATERDGKALPLAPAACKGRVIARSDTSALVACEGGGNPTELRLWSGGAVRTLDIKAENPPADDGYASQLARQEHELGEPARYTVVSSGGDQRIVDLATGKSHATGEHYVVGSHETKVLLHRRNGPFAIHDLASGAWVELPKTPPDMMISAQQGRLYAAGPRSEGDEKGVLVDLGAYAVLGTFPGPALAVSTSGWVLQPSPIPAGTAGAIESYWGPLHWVRPTR